MQNFTYTDPEVIHALYQITKDAVDIFEHVGLHYFAVAGTVLGTIRHKGIIPWDDDVDIGILETSESALTEQAQPLLNTIGYQLTPWWFGGYRIHNITGTPLENSKHEGVYCTFPFVDIFVMRVSNEVLEFTDEGAQQEWGHGIILAENVQDTSPYQFGEFEIQGPTEPEQYLATMYGDDWNMVAEEGYNHNSMADSSKSETLVDFAPAQPTGPLIARFQ
jgi:lipopolysaccharide cholinephosphotransferase